MIKALLLKVRQFAIDSPDVDQININPEFAPVARVKIVDARIVLQK